MSRRIMHVDLDAFFVSVEQALKPELKGKAVVVGGRPDQRGVVACASYEARALGLHAGMPLIVASRLCPQAIFIEGDFDRYLEVSGRFMAILANYSPFIEPIGIDEAFLDVTGFESLHGSIRQMALSIKQKVRQELGICASVGIAGCKIVAKVASDRSKPDGLINVPEGGERAFLAPLPVGDLPGIGKKSEKVLNSLGICTIGQLACLPVSTLKSRFGVYGELIHRHANGVDDSKVEPPRAAKSVSRETTFAKDTQDRALLEATLHYLSERVGAQLREIDKLGKCVVLKVRYSDFTTVTRRQTLTQSDNNDQTIFDTGLKLLKMSLTAQKQPVRLIGIGISGLTEPGRQMSMLDRKAQRLEQLNRAIDRIRKKYGFTAVQTGRTLPLIGLLLSEKQTSDSYMPNPPR